MFVHFQKTTLRPCRFWQQRGIGRITPTIKTEEKQSIDGKHCHTSRQQLCITAGCPGPNQRESTCITTICPPSRSEISWLTYTHKELFDIEIGSQKNCWPRKKLICLSA
ncbi:unnamed protein product [Pipistrellus nathusii]|uniref:Uncharacterized protein n=1 Tax=Pipistrellus nathusii TaxID=59473 RepID=A0ABP0AE90_PIPNA